MSQLKRTYRDVDGQRVEGTWRQVFTRNADRYSLTDLEVYADGAIYTGGTGMTDLAGLAELLRIGRVLTGVDAGARVSAFHLGSWQCAEPHFGLTAEMLLGEIADEIDRLNGRPDSTGRCLEAVQAYLEDPSEERRLVVRERYLAIPEHMRIYALGDMDRRDLPLQILVADLGGIAQRPPEEPFEVTAERRERAVQYLRDRQASIAEWAARVPPDGPEQAQAVPVAIRRTVYPQGWPDPPGTEVLQNDYPAPISVAGRTYPSVTHAYWALSTSDPEAHDQIVEAARGHEARTLAESAPRRQGWAAARLAVMSNLLRAKYTQNRALGEALLATGDARILYVDFDSGYWVSIGQHQSNWIGRLLEVVRSELAAEQAGIPIR